MARQATIWKSIAVGFEAFSVLFVSLAVGGGFGWLVGFWLPNLRFWLLFSGLGLGLIIAIIQILKLLMSEDTPNA